MQQAVNTSTPVQLTDEQQAVLLLWQLTNMSLAGYAKLLSHFGTAAAAVQASVADWQAIGVHASHGQRLSDYLAAGRHSEVLTSILHAYQQQAYGLVFYADSEYPALLKQLYDPPPVLFYQGNIQALSMPQLAVVGSRKPTPHADKIAFDMAQFLAHEGLWITSGMAEGIDRQAHLGALSQPPDKQGRTVAVLGNGIELCYPKQHLTLKQQIIASGGCVVSEFLPDTPSTRHNFPRRNRLVAGLSLATLVVEAALQSGSLITANRANEQGKQVFAVPSHVHNVNAKGCHQLIREGATLIDHPSQILEDLSVFHSPLQTLKNLALPEPVLSKNPASKPHEDRAQGDDLAKNFPSTFVDEKNALANQPANLSPNSQANLPPPLLQLLNQLDWAGQDIDSLVERTGLPVSTLMGQLLELELLGLAMQQAGLYLRCRA